MKNETCFFTCSDRSPSQDVGELDNFCSEIKFIVTNISNNQTACSIFIDNFNVKCWKCCVSEKNDITGHEIDKITATVDCSKLINKQN